MKNVHHEVTVLYEGNKITFKSKFGSTYPNLSVKNPEIIKQIIELAMNLSSYERTIFKRRSGRNIRLDRRL